MCIRDRPHIADKWYVHAVTRAYYETLLENGVRIYEYTPGFIHAKTFVVDDEYSVCLLYTSRCV